MLTEAGFVRLNDAVTEVLREGGRTLLMANYGVLDSSQIREKTSPGDLVTEIDLATEQFLQARLSAILPEAVCIGEEAAAADPSIVSALEGKGTFWVIDPIDGTRNFVRGVAEFGTIIALVINGETVGGWIYAAPDDAVYAANIHAPVTRNGVPVVPEMPHRVQHNDTGQTEETRPDGVRPVGLRSLGWLTDQWRDRITTSIKANTETAPSQCSAYAYIKLVQGHYDFKLSSRIHPWDHLAGIFMLSRAGGEGRFLDDGAVYGPRDSTDRPLLAVSPGRNWTEIANRIS